MQLAEVIQQSQLTEKAVRLYEAEGLIAPIKGGNGRRVYSDEDLARLKFLARARRLGFPLKDCRQLLDLKSSDSWTADDVHQVAESHLRALESKMQDLEQIGVFRFIQRLQKIDQQLKHPVCRRIFFGAFAD